MLVVIQINNYYLSFNYLVLIIPLICLIPWLNFVKYQFPQVEILKDAVEDIEITCTQFKWKGNSVYLLHRIV